MEIFNPEKAKPKKYLPEVRAIIESDIYLRWGIEALRDISDEEATLRHTRRMANCGYLLAKHLAKGRGYTREDIELFVEACLLHDIGKVEVPPKHLVKLHEEFGPEDFAEVSKHAYQGYEILRHDKRSPRVYYPVLFHHEFQERSYPDTDARMLKLLGDIEDVDVYVDLARLLAMLDVFDRLAFGSPPENPPIQIERAVEKLKIQFKAEGDAEIIDFLRGQYEKIKELS